MGKLITNRPKLWNIDKYRKPLYITITLGIKNT